MTAEMGHQNTDAPTIPSEDGVRIHWPVLFFGLLGLVAILLSVVLGGNGAATKDEVQGAATKGHGIGLEILKELGIVLLSVCTVSLVYERWVAKRYEAKFLRLLNDHLRRGEGAASVCARLGLARIFESRAEYARAFPIEERLHGKERLAKLWIVGKSLFFFVGFKDPIREALRRGATVELALLDPSTPEATLGLVQGLERSDITAAIGVFKRDIANWLVSEAPQCKVEVRYHQVPINDSLAKFNWDGDSLLLWDLSFGRLDRDKRVMMLGVGSSLGENLLERYQLIWNASKVVYRYANGSEETNVL